MERIGFEWCIGLSLYKKYKDNFVNVPCVTCRFMKIIHQVSQSLMEWRSLSFEKNEYLKTMSLYLRNEDVNVMTHAA